MPNYRYVKAGQALIAMLATSAGAFAEPPSPPPPVSSGQDVVVSGLGSSSGSSPFGDSAGTGVTRNGAVGSITAFSVGTISCNIGNADAIWIRSTAAGGNRHPVIGTQIYRYTTVAGAGRFEELGINWLKHGFCAADASNCTQLTNPFGVSQTNGSCDWLGPFNTDTYDASLNGSQSNLGPRSEINPWTGVYPYPYVLNWSATGDAIFKRTQVNTSDLGGGSNYVTEVVYITTDEPGRNRYNNYSYRMATSTSSTSFALSGTTKQGRPAIYAWKEQIDPTVTLVNIDPNGTGDSATDGRFVLGYKVTSLGGGQWHYEYAVMNMNNDRGAKGFSIPVSSLASVTNAGFHDVSYHSGEPYSGTDWTFTNAGGTASWDMVNTGANSNALRWSTMYNFRFDCNQPPIAGNATLTMFKTGTPTSVSVAVQVPAVPPPPTPGSFSLSTPVNGATGVSLTPALAWSASADATSYNVTVANDSALSSVVWTSSTGSTSINVPAATLVNSAHYWWGVTAVNGNGSTVSTPASFDFFTVPPPCVGDLNGDGHTGTADLTALLGNFGQSVTPGTGGDLNGDGTVGTADLTILLGDFGC